MRCNPSGRNWAGRTPERLFLVGLFLAVSSEATTIAQTPVTPASAPRSFKEQNAEARRWFQDARFGLSFHWGVYALLGKGESVMEKDRLPIAQYEKLPPRFNPSRFDAESWVRLAKSTGAKYIVMTSKDRDGFCMFDSRLTRYDIVDATPYAKDPLKALAEACRKHQVKLFLAYSLVDWHHPDYAPAGEPRPPDGQPARGEWKAYVAYYQSQVRELCTNYGAIGGIWFDGGGDRLADDWDLAGTYRMIHELQPAALIGNNLRSSPLPGEDVQLLDEDARAASRLAVTSTGNDRGFPLEVSLPLNDSRGYNAQDTQTKSVTQMLRALLLAAGQGANLTLAVGPRPDGTLLPQATERLNEVGKWLVANGSTLYGTRPGPIPPGDWGVSLLQRVGDRSASIFLHIEPSKLKGALVFPKEFEGYEASTFGTNKPLVMKKSERGTEIDISEAERTPIDTIVVLRPTVPGR